MSRHRTYATAIAVLLLASPLAAQDVARDTVAARTAPTAAVVERVADPLALLSPTRAPAWTALDVGMSANTPVASTREFIGPQSSESSAMMVVGGAALFAGVIISGRPGTILMVSGAVVGLVGLWRYAR